MDNKALYILAGYDDATEAHLAGIQKKLYEKGFSGVHTKNIPQHITLGSYPCEKEQELIEQLQKIASDTAAFDISLNHVGIFGGSKVLFIAPDINRSLLSLKENFGDSRDWTAHTTMLIDEPSVICEALPVVMENFSAFSGKVTSLHLYEFWPTRHITTVQLG